MLVSDKDLRLGRHGITVSGLGQTMKNLTSLKKVIPYGFMKLVAAMGVDLLSYSQPRVPYDTGELRESGTVTLLVGGKKLFIGRGLKDGTVRANFSMLSKSSGLVGPSTTKADVVVSYQRIGEDNLDVALWTHEELLPYESRPLRPAARQPYTGPKYLALAWAMREPVYKNAFAGSVEESLYYEIKKMFKLAGRRAFDFRVDEVAFVERTIDLTNYWGINPPEE
jgi:hypothetical protein